MHLSVHVATQQIFLQVSLAQSVLWRKSPNFVYKFIVIQQFRCDVTLKGGGTSQRNFRSLIGY